MYIVLGVGTLLRLKRLHIDCRLGNSLFSHFVNRFLDQYDSLDHAHMIHMIHMIMHIGVYSEQVAFV